MANNWKRIFQFICNEQWDVLKVLLSSVCSEQNVYLLGLFVCCLFTVECEIFVVCDVAKANIDIARRNSHSRQFNYNILDLKN